MTNGVGEKPSQFNTGQKGSWILLPIMLVDSWNELFLQHNRW